MKLTSKEQWSLFLTAFPLSFFSMYIYVPLVTKMQCPIFAFGHLTSRVEIKDVESLFSSFTSENISRLLLDEHVKMILYRRKSIGKNLI